MRVFTWGGGGGGSNSSGKTVVTEIVGKCVVDPFGDGNNKKEMYDIMPLSLPPLPSCEHLRRKSKVAVAFAQCERAFNDSNLKEKNSRSIFEDYDNL